MLVAMPSNSSYYANCLVVASVIMDTVQLVLFQPINISLTQEDQIIKFL